MKRSHADQHDLHGTKCAKQKEFQGATKIRECVDFFANEFLRGCFRQGGKFKNETWHVVLSFGTIVRVNLPQNLVSNDWIYNPQDYDGEYPKHRVLATDKNDFYAQAKENYECVLKTFAAQSHIIRSGMKMFLDAGYPLPGGEAADSFCDILACRGDAIAEENDENGKEKEEKEDEKEKEQEEEQEKEQEVGKKEMSDENIEKEKQKTTKQDKNAKEKDKNAEKREEHKDEDALFATFFFNCNYMIQTVAICNLMTPNYKISFDGRELRRLDYMFPRIVALIDRDAIVTFLE